MKILPFVAVSGGVVVFLISASIISEIGLFRFLIGAGASILLVALLIILKDQEISKPKIEPKPQIPPVHFEVSGGGHRYMVKITIHKTPDADNHGNWFWWYSTTRSIVFSENPVKGKAQLLDSLEATSSHYPSRTFAAKFTVEHGGAVAASKPKDE